MTDLIYKRSISYVSQSARPGLFRQGGSAQESVRTGVARTGESERMTPRGRATLDGAEPAP